MTEQAFVKALAMALVLREEKGKSDGLSSFNSLCSYLSEMNMHELLGVATQNGITEADDVLKGS